MLCPFAAALGICRGCNSLTLVLGSNTVAYAVFGGVNLVL